MQDAIASSGPAIEHSDSTSAVRSLPKAATLIDWAAALLSSVLLILSFPNFDLWPLAQVGFVPLLVVIARRPSTRKTFLLGWVTGAVFFYGSCHWLTFSMINYGGVPRWLAYMLLLPAPVIAGLFFGVFAFVLSRFISKWGSAALLVAPLLWPTLEWLRLWTIGQLWNAIGYSQAFHPTLIQPARWGGVYLIGFLIVTVNAALALLLVRRTLRATALAGLIVAGVATILFAAQSPAAEATISGKPDLYVVALQPNVPMNLVKTNEENAALLQRHFWMSKAALTQLPEDGTPRLLIWPESPMYFTYGRDSQLRTLLLELATANNTAVLFNSQEAAPNDGIYNSAVLVNEKGSLIAQYDKIRLMPFGEYVPLPRWMPGTSLIGAIVGDFTPGTHYTLMTVGKVRAGVFICIESAYPSIARNFTRAGAEVLINISNDGYLGPTAVMRQHLGNAVFRAVETGRPVLRVTNTGITAFITSNGEVKDGTESFQTAVRTWTIVPDKRESSFYARHGDVFVGVSGALSILFLAASFRIRKERDWKKDD